MPQYFIMDGRANDDPDDACVLEVFTKDNKQEAIKYKNKHYSGEDVVLVDENNNIIY